MELRPGFKQTEIGPIPDSWLTKRIGELGSVVRGGSPRPAGDPRFFDGAFIPWLTVAAMTNIPDSQVWVSETFSGLTEEGAKRSRTLSKGTLIIANSGATLGVAKLLGITCCANDGIAALLNQKSGSKEFLCHFINTQTKRLRGVIATGNGQPNLNTGLIRGIVVPSPPATEQQAIAQALSDVDALIGALDKLIAKKRDFKQAAMQQLLTGQTRLPGFNSEWTETRLGDLGSTFGGLVGKTKSDFGTGTGRYITFMNVMTNVVIDCTSFESVKVSPSESQNRAAKGDLFFNGSSETPDELAMCAVLRDEVQDVFLNSFCFGFRLFQHSAANALYLAYFFRSGQGRQLLKSLAQGAIRYNLSKAAFLKLVLTCPSAAEQSAIATVLSDMDAELVALEARRDKTRALKQGMMQELLTGRIRLV